MQYRVLYKDTAYRLSGRTMIHWSILLLVIGDASVYLQCMDKESLVGLKD